MVENPVGKTAQQPNDDGPRHDKGRDWSKVGMGEQRFHYGRSMIAAADGGIRLHNRNFLRAPKVRISAMAGLSVPDEPEANEGAPTAHPQYRPGETIECETILED